MHPYSDPEPLALAPGVESHLEPDEDGYHHQYPAERLGRSAGPRLPDCMDIHDIKERLLFVGSAGISGLTFIHGQTLNRIQLTQRPCGRVSCTSLAQKPSMRTMRQKGYMVAWEDPFAIKLAKLLAEIILLILSGHSNKSVEPASSIGPV